MRKPTFCICENKDADQLCGNRTTDQRLCFRYLDSTIPLLPKYKISSPSHLQWLNSLVCVRPGQNPNSCRGSNDNFQFNFFGFLAHLSRRLIGYPIVCPCSSVRPSSICPSKILNFLFSQTTWAIKAKFCMEPS